VSRSFAVALTVLLPFPALLPAQSVMAPGTRVKLRELRSDDIKDRERTGTILSQTGDTLFLRLEGDPRTADSIGTPYAVPLGAVRDLAIYRGRGPQPLKGVLYGGGGGLAVGLTVLLVLCGEKDVQPGPDEGDKDTCTLSDIGGILLFTAMLGAAGAVGGLVVGMFIWHDRWETVPTDRWRFGLHPIEGGGMGFRFSAAF
jgi:hypothetical protein